MKLSSVPLQRQPLLNSLFNFFILSSVEDLAKCKCLPVTSLLFHGDIFTGRTFDIANASTFKITSTSVYARYRKRHGLDIGNASTFENATPALLKVRFQLSIEETICVGFGIDRYHCWCWNMAVGLVTSERTQLSPSGFLTRFRIDETLRASPGATCDVSSLYCYVPDFEFLPSPGRFASTSRNTQTLWPQTRFLRSPGCSALIGFPLAPPGEFSVLEHIMSSSSPSLTFRFVPSLPVLCFAHYLLHQKAINDAFPTHLRPSRTTLAFASNQQNRRNQTPALPTPTLSPLAAGSRRSGSLSKPVAVSSRLSPHSSPWRQYLLQNASHLFPLLSFVSLHHLLWCV